MTLPPARVLARAPDRERLLAGFSEWRDCLRDWPFWAHPRQLPPAGDWRVWLMLAGRGFGKTRAGAEWVRALAEGDGNARIALVGATRAEARAVMIEGDSGVMTISPAATRPRWEPSRGVLTWRSGARAFVYSGESPDGLRGPQHSAAWCDEIAKWAYPQATWDNLAMTLRLGDTAGFAKDVDAMRASLDGPLVSGAEKAGRGIETALVRAVRNGKLGFEDLGKTALSILDQIAAQAVRGGIDALIGGGSGGSGLGSLLAGLLTGSPGRAIGGPVSPGRAYLVGERGPELFVPASAGQVQAAARAVNVAISIAAGAGDAPRALQQSGRQVARAVKAAIAGA